MKKTLLVSVIMILLTGCAKEQDLFAKKQECANLINKVENRIATKYKTDDRIVELKKIFYSKKANSCLYKYYISERINSLNLYTYRLVDAFTDEILFEREGCLMNPSCMYSFTEASNLIDEKIKEYE